MKLVEFGWARNEFGQARDECDFNRFGKTGAIVSFLPVRVSLELAHQDCSYLKSYSHDWFILIFQTCLCDSHLDHLSLALLILVEDVVLKWKKTEFYSCAVTCQACASFFPTIESEMWRCTFCDISCGM